MIKEFWQERKENRQKQKELKKQKRKLPKTKEQRSYKIFGVCFTLFLIFGSIFYACRGLNMDCSTFIFWCIVIEDIYGEYDCMVFGKVYENFSETIDIYKYL